MVGVRRLWSGDASADAVLRCPDGPAAGSVAAGGAFSATPLQRSKRGARLAHVLEAIEAMHRAGIWLELTTLIIPGHNDGDDEKFSCRPGEW